MFHFGAKSQSELEGVRPDLVEGTTRALALTPIDFAVFDGLRTMAEQAEYVRTGVSKTMNSKHLPQPDGLGWAVDLVPYINGKLRWELGPCCEIAGAMHEATAAAGFGPGGPRIRWGACWDRKLDELDRADLAGEVEAYIERRKAAGKRAFIDGPHFEVVE